MKRTPRSRHFVVSMAVLALLGTACGSDDDTAGDSAGSETTTAAVVTTVAASDATEAMSDTTEAVATTEAAAPAFDGELVGTFSIDPADCSAGAATAGSYFRMLMAGGTVADGPFIDNADSKCTDTTYTALTVGTDGGLTTGASQPAPEPAFDATGNGLAAAIFEPVPFFAVAFAGATDPAEAVPSITAADGVLSGDLSAFTAYYGTLAFNQGAPKPDGSGEGPTGTIDPATGAYVLNWSSLISGGSFDGFTGVWHLEGTFSPA